MLVSTTGYHKTSNFLPHFLIRTKDLHGQWAKQPSNTAVDISQGHRSFGRCSCMVANRAQTMYAGGSPWGIEPGGNLLIPTYTLSRTWSSLHVWNGDHKNWQGPCFIVDVLSTLNLCLHTWKKKSVQLQWTINLLQSFSARRHTKMHCTHMVARILKIKQDSQVKKKKKD